MKKSFLLGVLLIALLIVPFANAVADNNVPRTINYTGNLFDYAGQPINKAVDLNVKIFNSQTGGSALWTEDQRNVQVEYGYFSINLGTEAPLNLDFKTQYWVELSVNGNSYARVPFTSTPYSFRSMRSTFADTATIAKTVFDKSITIANLADETRVVTGDITGTYPELYIKDGVVVSKIGKGQITNYHISPSVSLPPAGPAGGALTGQYPDPKLAENAVETFNIMDGSITYPKLRNAAGPMGTILVWNGNAWVESTVPEWQTPEVDGVIGNEVMWATNGLEILTNENGQLGVGIKEGGVTNDMLAGGITTDKLAGNITLDKLAAGTMPGQVMWWNNIAKEWVLTPNAPHENYVIKWIFNHEAGQAQLEWAEDNMSIPFFYEGSSIDPLSTEPNLYSKTMFELILDGARGVVDNSVHGIAVTINDAEAGSSMVLTGSGMSDGNMLPVAVITAKPYVGSASYDKGILNVSAQVGTLADLPSYGQLVDHVVTGTNHGITSTGAGFYNNIGDNRVNGLVLGVDVMATTKVGDNTGKVIGGNFMANGAGSDIGVGVAGVSMNAKYNTGLFGGVNTGATPWATVKANLPASITNVGTVAFGPVSSNTLALYAYGNSQFDGDITVKNNALVNQNLTVQGIGTFNGTINTTGLFQLDGVQGAVKEILIGNGAGNTPVWTSVANLMENLTDGAGIVTFLYDGSAPAKVIVDYDATLKMDVAGDAGKLGLDLAHQNSWTALQTFATVDINGGNIDGTVIGATTPAVGTFTNLFATNETVSGLLTAATVDINGGNIDNTVIGSAVRAAGYFTNVTAANATITGLLTALNADIENIDAEVVTIEDLTVNTADIETLDVDDLEVVDITAENLTATTGYIATLTSDYAEIEELEAVTGEIETFHSDNAAIDNLIAENLTTNVSINTNGTFALDGVQGAVKNIMIGNGTGNTPVWITVANLMEELTAGAGLVGPDYDGSADVTFAVDYDATLKMDVAGIAGKLGIDLAHANSWTGLQTFATVDINGGNIDGTVIGATTPAVGTFTNLFATNETVSGLLTAATVDLNGGNIDNTVIGATVPAAATFTNVTVNGLLTAANVDINGGTIDNTVIGATTPVAGTFTTIIAATGDIDDLESETLEVSTSLTLEDAAELLASNGSGTPSAGNIGEVLVSRGTGLSPEWTTTVPLLDVTELTTDHLVVNDNTTPGMEPYFEVPFAGNREAVFGAPGLGQGVDVTIYGTLTTNNLEVINTVPFLEIYDLNITHNITLDGKIIGGDADFDLLSANNLTADLITVDRLHVNIDTYLTDVEAHGLAEFYGGATVTGGDLIVNGGNDIIAKNDLEVHGAIFNPTQSGVVQLPVLVSDPEGLNVPNGPVHAKRLTLGVANINAIGNLPNADAGIINYSDVVNIAQADLPTAALDGEVLYIANTSAGTVTILGTPVATQNMIVLVYLAGNWIVMP